VRCLAKPGFGPAFLANSPSATSAWARKGTKNIENPEKIWDFHPIRCPAWRLHPSLRTGTLCKSFHLTRMETLVCG
jgi:hypothetical protein